MSSIGMKGPPGPTGPFCDCLWKGVLEDKIEWLQSEVERLQDEVRDAYKNCIDAVNKIKTDPFTEIGSRHRMKFSEFTAKDWMVAFAEDVEREIKARAALGEKE